MKAHPRERVDRLALLVFFALSRFALHAAGVRFDATSLTWFWQFIEPDLLQNDLARSLFYLHMQPPGFNLFLGLVLKVAPIAADAIFAALFALAGLALGLASHALLLRLGAPRAAAFAGAALTIVSPDAMLFENWLFYEYPVALALVVAALALHRYLSSFALRDGFAYFALVAAIPLTRSLFHLVWAVAAAAAVLPFVPSRERRRTALLALIPLLAVGGLYLKNGIVFGRLEASSWSGMSFARIALQWTPVPVREAMVREGRLSPLALHRPFASLNSYPKELRAVSPRPVPVLSRPKKASGRTNFNHEAFLEISAAYARDARAMVAARPDLYLGNVASAFAVYSQPATADLFFIDNREKIARYAELWNVTVLGGLGVYFSHGVSSVPEFPFLARDALYGWMAIFALSALAACFSGLRLARSGGDAPGAATRLFLAANVIYVTAVATLFELGENSRFRFLVDSIAWVLATLLVVAVVRRARAHPKSDRVGNAAP